MADADLFDSWFRLADRDRDGRISGLEAKEFMSRSDLSTETLFKVRGARPYSSSVIALYCTRSKPLQLLSDSRTCGRLTHSYATGLVHGGRQQPFPDQASILQHPPAHISRSGVG